MGSLRRRRFDVTSRSRRRHRLRIRVHLPRTGRYFLRFNGAKGVVVQLDDSEEGVARSFVDICVGDDVKER